MKKLLLSIYLCAIIGTLQSTYAQQKMPVILANSIKVDIKQDDRLVKNAWKISPKINPDVFKTSAKKVTFYTDVDSISFDVKPKAKYDFIILLNKKDSAITRIEQVPSKLDILKKGGEYNLADNRFVPKFKYQSQDNPHLVKLRKELKLDSIAGNGNELSKIFNLMHWIHNSIKHDGNSNKPFQKNAMSLIKLCKAKKRGLNCRMLAIVLNECYLSMGIYSKYITCMPRETNFQECHVINTVYSRDLGKWIWLDPTFDAYVMDEKGQLLGIQEVRERLVNDKPVVLNASANWNRRVLQTKAHYLKYYMAKNLYRMEVPLVSEYNAETWTKGKTVNYVELLPLDGIQQTPQKQEFTNKKTGVKFITYKTNNPQLFWAKPESGTK